MSTETSPATLRGWAARLNITADAKQHQAAVDQHTSKRTKLWKEKQAAQWKTAGVLATTQLMLDKTWSFLSNMAGTQPPVLEATTTAYQDKAPRWVTYGDSWVESSSLGVPDPSKLQGFTHYNIAFWMSTGASDNAQEWVQGSQEQQKAIVKSYNDAGIRLGVAVFGATDKPQSDNNDPWDLAKKIVKFVKNNNLQGVDVDYEEFDYFDRKEATKWIIPLTRGLRDGLPEDQYYLSHAPIAPLFNTDIYPLGYTWIEQDIGSLINFYNVQFYNQEDYDDAKTLVVQSGDTWPNTALLQLHSVYNIPMSKLVCGKPARPSDAADGWITAKVLGKYLQKAADQGWNGGCMWWEYAGQDIANKTLKPVQSTIQFSSSS